MISTVNGIINFACKVSKVPLSLTLLSIMKKDRFISRFMASILNRLFCRFFRELNWKVGKYSRRHPRFKDRNQQKKHNQQLQNKLNNKNLKLRISFNKKQPNNQNQSKKMKKKHNPPHCLLKLPIINNSRRKMNHWTILLRKYNR